MDALLLDSGDPKRAVKELGGTDRIHDWRLSREICRTVAWPVFLAGSLHAGNVAEAVAAVQRYGLDLCSGVRTHGALDGAKLKAFFAALSEVPLGRPVPRCPSPARRAGVSARPRHRLPAHREG